ncbi:hypothetical protein BU25DRAFT_439375 [Macroventuria anomochaeta]|uniref:Uncharacterized protein n=1 Tax=Macroventuria anomochaeta TaxID=301207 RepID=A0ACB6S2W2_9PLEO|nr:uncharacterized protein BU25DRAFT_439375 [Macroventuria anomochaeta]KAF2628368.1 hypothetical protein BU25DRAFT_439375 [Macroventuria anomochaeta]
MSISVASTLYPKITQHVSEAVKVLKKLQHNSDRPDKDKTLESILLVGSVKLHGTRADMLVYNGDKIVLQSKDVFNITIANDNQGFAAAMADNANTILDIRDQYLARWKFSNPNTPSPHRCINNSWVQDTLYPSIEAPSSCIYDIARGGTFTATLYPDNTARTLSEIETLADAVASYCPFATSFGVHGEGENIVWKPAPPCPSFNPTLWFKTKGGRFKPTFAAAPKSLPIDQKEKRDNADAVAAIWDVGVGRDMRTLGKYLKWVQSDILTEKKAYIEDNGVDEGMLRISIAKIAWYIRHVGLREE